MSKNSLLSTSLFKDLTNSAEAETTEQEQQMRTLREKVLQSAAQSLEPITETDVVEDITVLQQRLDAAMFRTSRKEMMKKALEFHLIALKSEQEATFPLDQATHSSVFHFPSESVSQSEFNTTLMWERKCKLEDDLATLTRKMDAEALLSEQMAYLLQNTKESTKAARLKSDQLRYLQKRLLKRHDDIITMHTRAENELLHVNHEMMKATEEAGVERSKRETIISSKRRIADSLKIEVEKICESVARRQLLDQEAETKRLKAVSQLTAIESTHRNVLSLQSSTRLSVDRTNASLSQLQRYCLSSFLTQPVISSFSINTSEIVNSFHRLQFQNSSLNERFSGMSEQENQLKLTCSLLREEMEDLHRSLEGTSALQASMKTNQTVEYTTFNQMLTLLDRQDDSKGLEKRVRSYESFTLSLILNTQEALRRQFSYLSFIGNYAGGHLEKLTGVIASLGEKEGYLTDRSGSNKTKSPHKVGNAGRRTKERGSESLSDVGKDDTIANVALGKLREELLLHYPSKRRIVDLVQSAASEILPVRECSVETLGKVVKEEGEAGEGDERRVVENIVGGLVKEGNAAMRIKAEEVIRTMKIVLDAISISRREIKEMISAYPLTPTQQHQMAQEKVKMRERVQGPPLKDIPEKLVETLTSEFESRVKSLAAHRRNDNFGGLDLSRTRPANLEESSMTQRILELEKEASQEMEEQALLSSERRLMRLGLSPHDQTPKSAVFTAAKISSLSSIRRAADLEKKLLEQVQGVEIKLKRIKSRGED